MATKRKAKKKVAKKKTTKRKATKRKAAKKAPAVKGVRERMTKSQLMASIADETELSKKEVIAVIDSLSRKINSHVKKGAVGEFVLPGLLKIKVNSKPATKARKGINPFTGEACIFKAKPARKVVKIRPLSALKNMV